MSREVDHDTFPTEEMERLNIYAGNYFPSGNVDYQQSYYLREYEPQNQHLQYEQGWSDHSHHSQKHHRNKHHHSSHYLHASHQPLDLSNAHTLKSNLLKLLSDGRILLLSRIPILYRTKYGKEFREDIEGEGKIKLIDVFQAIGSPFVLIGEGGNASVRREIPYGELSSSVQNSNYDPNADPNDYTALTYQSQLYGNPSETWPRPRRANPQPITVYEAEIRLRQNLDLLLEDGKAIFFADLPTLYKSKFGIDYREGVELRGRMKLRRLFQHYGFPFVVEGEGLETTVRKVQTASISHSAPSSWTLYQHTSNSNPDYLNSESSLHFPPLVSPLTSCHYSRSSQIGSKASHPHLTTDNPTNGEDQNSSADILSRLDYLNSPNLSFEGNFENVPNPSLAQSHLQLSTSSTASSYPLCELSLTRNSSEYPTNQPILTPNLSSQSYTTTSSATVQSFPGGSVLSSSSTHNSIIIDHSKWDKLLNVGYLGILKEPSMFPTYNHSNAAPAHIFFNSTNPFCVVSVGQPGSGRSHTLSVLLENCLLTSPLPVQTINSSHHLHLDLTQGSNEIFAEETLHDESLDAQHQQQQIFIPPLIHSQSEICTMMFHSNPHKILSSDIPKIASNCSYYSHPAERAMNNFSSLPMISRGIRRVIILVSPTYFLQQKKQYELLDSNYVVLPLILQWSSLQMNHIKRLMRLSDSILSSDFPNSNSHQHGYTPPLTSQQRDNYPSCLVDILKEYQSLNKPLSYEEYIRLILQRSDEEGNREESWREWIQKRINFMKYFIDEFYLSSPSHQQTHSSSYTPLNFSEIFQAGHFVLCDFTDPSLSSDECTSLYHLLLMIYRSTDPIPSSSPLPHSSANTACQKLFVMENLFQYLHRVMTPLPLIPRPSSGLPSSSTIPLSDQTHLPQPTLSNLSKYEFALEVMDLVRHFNDEKMKVILTAQSPLDIPPDVLEFSTMTIVHQCQAQDGFDYLLRKLPMKVDHFDDIRSLQVGQALLVTCRGKIDSGGSWSGATFPAPHISVPAPGPMRKQYVYPILIRERVQNL
jgi:hypothetical protein